VRTQGPVAFTSTGVAATAVAPTLGSRRAQPEGWTEEARRRGPQSVATLTRYQGSVSALGTSWEEPFRLEHYGTYRDKNLFDLCHASIFQSTSCAFGECDPVDWIQTSQPPDPIDEVPAPSTMLGCPGALREPQRTATSDTLRAHWRRASRASPYIEENPTKAPHV